VRGAVVGENLTPIGEYSSTVKNRRKCATVYRRVVVKGLVSRRLNEKKRKERKKKVQLMHCFKKNRNNVRGGSDHA
jgi:hypothetical protein